MASLNNFSIPVRGLKSGVHHFNFDLDSAFFAEFEESPIKDGQFKVAVSFDKRPDMFVLDIDIEGTMQTECDRCLEELAFPINGQHQQIIKLSEQPASVVDEVVYLPIDTTEVNIASFIYEFVILSIPMIKTCDAVEDTSCNEAVLRKLEGDEAAKEGNDGTNPIWEALKGLKKD